MKSVHHPSKRSFFSFNLQFFNLPFIAVESVLHRVIEAVLQFRRCLRLMLLKWCLSFEMFG
jgi:hypothetical protein